MRLKIINKLILLGIILLFKTTIFSQTVDIVDIDWTPDYPKSGYYYKDINHVLVPFVGTYEFDGVIDGNNVVFTLKLDVMTHSSMVRYWEDLLIGAFSYKVNNEELINNLDELDVAQTNGAKYPIHGRMVYTGPKYGIVVGPNEKWLKISIQDSDRSGDSLFIVKKILDTGEEAIEIIIYHHMVAFNENDPIPPPLRYPIGKELVLIKQP